MHSEESIILLINKKLAVTFQTDVYLCLCPQNNLKLMSVRQWQVQGIKTTVPSSGSLLVPPTAGGWLSYLAGHRRSSGLGQAVANRRVGVGGEITTAQDDDIKVGHSL